MKQKFTFRNLVGRRGEKIAKPYNGNSVKSVQFGTEDITDYRLLFC